MLGFQLDFWDYLTFLTLLLVVVAVVVLWVWLAGLPGRIAIARNHPGGRGGQADGLRRPPADGISVDAGLHLGVQADRRHRHPALPARRKRRPPTRRCPAAREAPVGAARGVRGRGRQAGLAGGSGREGLRGIARWLLGLVLLFAYVVVVWLVFFKFRWLKFSIPWGVVSFVFVLHLLIIFLIGLRFVTPYVDRGARSSSTRSSSRRAFRSRRSSPPCWSSRTCRSRRARPLFQFDRRTYEYKVRQLEAQLAQANAERAGHEGRHPGGGGQGRRDSRASSSTPSTSRSSPPISPQHGAGPEEDAQKWCAQVAADRAAIKEAQAEQLRAKLDTRRRSAASTRRWRRCRPSSTRRASTSTTR